MRKKRVKGLICVLACALFLPSCNDNVGDTSDNARGVTVWGMPGTEKVYENIDQSSAYYAKYKSAPAVNLTMAKGEYEGSQIIVSANEDTVFDFESADLVCGENKIAKKT